MAPTAPVPSPPLLGSHCPLALPGWDDAPFLLGILQGEDKGGSVDEHAFFGP